MNDETATPTTPTMALRAQYVKDLSFENPRAPHSLFNTKQAPALDVNINLAANKIDAVLAELEIHIGVTAQAEGEAVFKTELVYAGVLELRNLAPAEAERALFVAGANLLYPFARRVIADATRDGGFPPVQLEPIDFAGLYMQRMAQAAGPGSDANH